MSQPDAAPLSTDAAPSSVATATSRPDAAPFQRDAATFPRDVAILRRDGTTFLSDGAPSRPASATFPQDAAGFWNDGAPAVASIAVPDLPIAYTGMTPRFLCRPLDPLVARELEPPRDDPPRVARVDHVVDEPPARRLVDVDVLLDRSRRWSSSPRAAAPGLRRASAPRSPPSPRPPSPRSPPSARSR